MAEITSKREGLTESWKKRFEILDKVDGAYFSRAKELSMAERWKVGFRFFAFVFSVLYYFAKGMWEKGLLIWTAYAVLGIVLGALGVPDMLVAIAMVAACASLATIDYYNKVEHDERIWPFLAKLIPENLRTIPALAVVTVVALGLNIAFATGLLGTAGLPSCGDREVTDLVQELFDENSGYKTQSMDFVRMREQHEQTGAYTCETQIVDNDGDKWQVTYQISKDERQPLGYIVQAEWSM